MYGYDMIYTVGPWPQAVSPIITPPDSMQSCRIIAFVETSTGVTSTWSSHHELNTVPFCHTGSGCRELVTSQTPYFRVHTSKFMFILYTSMWSELGLV